MAIHKNLVTTDIHSLYAFTYANATARNAAVVVTADIGKLAWQTNDDTFWILKNTTPTWVDIGTTASSALSNTAAGWTSANTVLNEAQMGFETDANPQRFKVGDGVTAWNSLDYWKFKEQHLNLVLTGGTYTLSSQENQAGSFEITGVLTSNQIIIVADTRNLFIAENLTTGAYTLTIKTLAGTGIAITQGYVQSLYANGVNVEVTATAGAGSGDVSSNTGTSVADEIALFADATGKLIKRSTGTGIPKLASGVMSVATKLATTDVYGNGSTTLTLDDMLTDSNSAGWIEGLTINDIGSGNVTVDAGEVFIRTGATATSPLLYKAISALGSTNVPSGATRYVVVNYNAGSPIIQVSASNTSNGYTILYMGEVHNIGGTLMIHNDHRPVGDGLNRLMDWATNIIGLRVASGEVVTDPTPTSRKIAVTAGSIYDRYFRNITTAAFDSSGAGTMVPYYRDGASGFLTETATATWENTKYDNNSGTLAAMTAAYYANRWIIRGINGNVAYMYGQAEYLTQALAEAEGQPASRPEEYDEHGFFVAQITFQKSATGATTITSIKPVINAVSHASGTSVHNDLTGIQGGTGGQYYHSTSAEYTGTGTGNFVRATSPTLVTPVLGVATATSLGVGAGADASAIVDVHQVGNTIPMIQAQDGGTSSATSGGIFQATLDNGAYPATATRIGGYQYSVDGGDAVKRLGAAINALTTQQWTSANNGTQLKFNITANNSSTRTTALTLDQDASATFAGAISNGTSNPISTGTIELGHATDTTISRVSAGTVAVEGNNVMTVASVDVITGSKTFNDGILKLNGATSGASTLKAPAVASTYVHTLPAGTGTLAELEFVQTFTKAQIGGVVSLSVSGNAIATDLSLSNNFSVSLQATTSQVLSNPTNMVAGQSGQIAILQNATPSALTYGAYWIPFDGTTPSVSTTASAQNLITYYVVDSTHVWYVLNKHGVA